NRGRMSRAVRPLVPTGVDPVGREEDVGGHGDVRGRETEVTAPGVALFDEPPHLVRPTQHLGGLAEIAGAHKFPYERRRDRAVAGAGDEREPDDLETGAGADVVQELDIPPAPPSEVKVLADDDEP